MKVVIDCGEDDGIGSSIFDGRFIVYVLGLRVCSDRGDILYDGDDENECEGCKRFNV